VLPERGRIGIFNRSYYEEVLVVRVHPEILRSQGLPEELRDEKEHLGGALSLHRGPGKPSYRNGTRIVKVFLHLSKDEQRKRFLERIDEPDKNWKFSLADIHERKYWKDYMEAYEECLSATSTHHAPWYVVPADDKENARLIVSQIVLDALKTTPNLKMAYPKDHPETPAGNCPNLVRRGEAVAEVTATGTRTKFGRTAELVRTAHVESSQQKAVLRVVRNLAMVNGVVILMLVGYAYVLKMPGSEIIPLVLTGFWRRSQ
jgi:hypothetical protein